MISVNFPGVGGSSCSNASTGNCAEELVAAGFKSSSSCAAANNGVSPVSGGLSPFYAGPTSHHHQPVTDSMGGIGDSGLQHPHQLQQQQQVDGLSSTFGFTQEQVACVCEVRFLQSKTRAA